MESVGGKLLEVKAISPADLHFPLVSLSRGSSAWLGVGLRKGEEDMDSPQLCPK